MSQAPSQSVQGSLAPGAPLSVLDGMRLGWRLMVSDFWRLWLAALVMQLILMAVSGFGAAATIVVMPPLIVGLYYVIARRIDGAETTLGDLFAGFQHRFGPSVVGYLPLTLSALVLGALFGFGFAIIYMCGVLGAMAADGHEVVAVVIVLAVLAALLMVGVLTLAVMAIGLFLMFVPPAVWDRPDSGWEAARTSARMALGRLGSMIGLVVLFFLIQTAATLVGLLACCIGVIFTGPVVVVWEAATVIYLYRSWTGRPLVQPPGVRTA